MDIDRRYKIALLGMVTAIGCTAKSTIERKKGRWGNAGEYPWDKCSVCGHCVNPYEDDYFFCPNCGADMRGGKNEVQRLSALGKDGER